MPKLVPVNKSSFTKLAVILLGLLFLIYMLENFWLASLIGGFIGSYVIRPLLWLVIVWLVYKKYPLVTGEAKLRLRPFLIQITIICGIVWILANVAGGLIDGFGKSPYSLSIKGIIINVILLTCSISGLELSRAWLLNSVFKKNKIIGISVVGLLMSFFWFQFSKLTGLNEGITIVKFLGTTLFPALSENVFLCYLAILGGPLPAIIFRGIISAFHWFFPILPNMEWITLTLIGTFIPILCLILVQQGYLSEARKNKKVRDEEDTRGAFITSIAAIILVWFAAGVFSIYPSVIVSGSMYPAIKVGDMILIKRTDPAYISTGDIIQFEMDKVRVVHRVIEIVEKDGKLFFITKGDNNKTIDSDPVLPEQIRGSVIKILPKLGWASIAIRSPNAEIFKQTADEINAGGGSGE